MANESQQIQDPNQESFFLSFLYSYSLSYNALLILYNQRAKLSFLIDSPFNRNQQKEK